MALNEGGHREIGGQLFGEQLAPSQFLVTNLTVQARRGSYTRFIVDLFQAARDAMRFFDSTQHDYTRHNYIGEWHSHPSFKVRPSGTDLTTMRELVRDPGFKGTFAVLMIVRLDADCIAAAAWNFDPLGREGVAQLEIEND
ncbi:hypothetical protein OB2597_05125 [Pseudooceanicola batsensis HTCC2597]|uniref:JAB domain-containing protein n=1 Tax=Pseudooceanicola batsensis (strain ATCC BAA-863 / DSM 15984 / KCTC 12145 / HTCC2597) TaxID=252305 RepID=A3TSL0_PSEBH|nr:Mov34/MPN/PAD-1 family protein [Pseudooceanicola batsensis]EAQ04637.1 hypothetical protein OB2597_05125 [Pseudooceanicola batsensis HTCC2597]